MEDGKWERWAALGGILFVVLVAATAILPGSPPKTTDSAAKIAKFFADKDSELRWSAYLGGLATVFVFWWMGSIWRLISRAEGDTPRLAVFALAGLVFGTVMAGVSALVFSTIAIRGVPGSGGADGVKFFYVLGWVISGAAMFGIAAFLGAFSVVIIRAGVLPRALGWFGAVVALVALVGGATVASTRDALFVVSFIAFIGFLLWILIASALMLRNSGAGSSAAPAPSTA